MEMATETATAKIKTKVKAIIPFEDFLRIWRGFEDDLRCRDMWCPFLRTTCYVRTLREACRVWWNETNGLSPGFANYELVLNNCIDCENKLYWGFWVYRIEGRSPTVARELAQATHDCFTENLRMAFQNGEVDSVRCRRNVWPI